jgi:hypothetical protein
MILVVATVAVLLVAGIPAMAKPAQTAHVPAVALLMPNEVGPTKHYPYMPLVFSMMQAIVRAVPLPVAW